MSEHIQILRQGDLAEVRLNRPDKRNALSFAMLGDLIDAAQSLSKDKDLRAVLLTGEGECFSAGIDLGDLRDKKKALRAAWELAQPTANLFQRAFLCFRDLPVPVIAAIHGHCLGAGLQLALAADFRIARPDAQLAIMEAKWGLVPDMGASVTLRGLLGADTMRELMMTARLVTGEKAKEIGLISHIDVDPRGRALALVDELRERSPDAVAAAKRLCNAIETQGPATTLGLERRLQTRLLLGKNFAIAGKRAKSPELAWKPRSLG